MLGLRKRRGRGGLQRYLGAGETVLLSTRQHPFALVRAGLDTLWLVAPLMIAAWGIAGIEALQGAPGSWLLRLLFLAMVAFVIRLAWSVLAWELERVVVTDEKVILVTGVLDRRIASTPLSKVSDFAVRQPLLGRIFDYGSLVVDVPGGSDQALHGLGYLPNPTGIYRLVSEQARRGRTREGGGRVAAETPTDEQLSRLDERAGAGTGLGPVAQTPVDPWQPVVQPVDSIEHTIQIPRIEPR
jgi:hypothetical protein